LPLLFTRLFLVVLVWLSLKDVELHRLGRFMTEVEDGERDTDEYSNNPLFCCIKQPFNATKVL
jgi:hypothetical protein